MRIAKSELMQKLLEQNSTYLNTEGTTKKIEFLENSSGAIEILHLDNSLFEFSVLPIHEGIEKEIEDYIGEENPVTIEEILESEDKIKLISRNLLIEGRKNYEEFMYQLEVNKRAYIELGSLSEKIKRNHENKLKKSKDKIKDDAYGKIQEAIIKRKDEWIRHSFIDVMYVKDLEQELSIRSNPITKYKELIHQLDRNGPVEMKLHPTQEDADISQRTDQITIMLEKLDRNESVIRDRTSSVLIDIFTYAQERSGMVIAVIGISPLSRLISRNDLKFDRLDDKGPMNDKIESTINLIRDKLSNEKAIIQPFKSESKEEMDDFIAAIHGLSKKLEHNVYGERLGNSEEYEINLKNLKVNARSIERVNKYIKMLGEDNNEFFIGDYFIVRSNEIERKKLFNS